MTLITAEMGEHEILVSGRQVRVENLGPGELEVAAQVTIKMIPNSSRLLRIDGLTSIHIRSKTRCEYHTKVFK